MELNNVSKHYQSHNRVCIKETSDNGFIIGITYSAGWAGGMINKAYKGVLVKTDIDGIIQWIKEWEVHTTIETVFPVADGIITWIWVIDNYVNISKIGLDGRWHWNKTCPDEDWTFSVWWAASGMWFAGVPLDTIITSTGEYAIAGITTPPFDSKSIDAWLAKRDANGNLLWKHIYGTHENFKVINQTIMRITKNQTSEGVELIPLFVSVVFLKFWFNRRRVYAKWKNYSFQQTSKKPLCQIK